MAETFERARLAGREDDLARIEAREVPFPSQVSVRSRNPRPLGLPTEANTWTPLNAPREALWLGPDEWLVVGRPGLALLSTAAWQPVGLAAPIFEGLDGADALVDVSASRAVLELDGAQRFDLFEQGCGLDLHPRSWRDGRCAQTLLARVPVILQEREASTRVFVRPSFAGSLVDWLMDAAGRRRHRSAVTR